MGGNPEDEAINLAMHLGDACVTGIGRLLDLMLRAVDSYKEARYRNIAQGKDGGLTDALGKAVDHEVEGSHAVIGADLARRFGEKADIVHAIEAHHNDVEPSSVLAVLVQAADAVSAARPGARKETLDAYVKRLEKLEEIASSYKGVERTYAIQAGREVRVMVEPDTVDEAATTVLAHDIAQRIENEMQYPGQVKVVVIRESRAVGVAK